MRPTPGPDRRYGPDKGGRGQKVVPPENATRLGRRSSCLLIIVHHQPTLTAEPPQPNAGASKFARPAARKVVRLAMPRLYGIIGMNLEMAFMNAPRERERPACL